MHSEQIFRNKQQSKEQKSRLSWIGFLRLLVLIALLATVIWGWRLLKDPHFMPIKDIQVQASYQHINSKTLGKIIAPYVTAQGIFTTNVEALKQALLQIPWVYDVVIRRVWPDTVQIEIVEQQPVAQWDKNALINAEADIFTPALQTFPKGLPQLRGPQGLQQTVLQQYQQMNAAIVALGLKIVELDLSQRRSWQAHLDNGIVVLLGRGDVMPEFTRFVAVYPKVIGDRAASVQSVDLRYNNGLAIHWQAQNNIN